MVFCKTLARSTNQARRTLEFAGRAWPAEARAVTVVEQKRAATILGVSSLNIILAKATQIGHANN